MKAILVALVCIVCYLTSCTKSPISTAPRKVGVNDHPASFIHYTIERGSHYSNRNPVIAVDYRRQQFIAVFDSSAVYRTINPANQYDVNKLYGFSDNNEHHHRNSARFGWRWSDSALRIFAYVYNEGAMMTREIGTITIGTAHQFEIEISQGSYIFTLNEKKLVMSRTSRTHTGIGYKLYPYFGGDEAAPHDVRILIREIN
ncbi:hypothetical protein ACX0G7_08385 [Flavitalea antarctica]